MFLPEPDGPVVYRISDLPLLGRVGHALELAVAGGLELPELLDQIVNKLFLVVQRETFATRPLYFPPSLFC